MELTLLLPFRPGGKRCPLLPVLRPSHSTEGPIRYETSPLVVDRHEPFCCRSPVW